MSQEMDELVALALEPPPNPLGSVLRPDLAARRDQLLVATAAIYKAWTQLGADIRRAEVHPVIH
jgi:hypothetical protein